MTFIDPKTILLAASLVSGGAIGGVSALDENALEGVQEAMAASAVDESVTETPPEAVEDEPAIEVTEVVETAATEPEAAPLVAPGRRVRGEAGKGAEHRSARATETLSRARARSPLANPGAEHRNARATAAIERAAARGHGPRGGSMR